MRGVSILVELPLLLPNDHSTYLNHPPGGYQPILSTFQQTHISIFGRRQPDIQIPLFSGKTMKYFNTLKCRGPAQVLMENDF